MNVSELDWRRATATLEETRSVALACHLDPDGDAIGSMLALQHALRRRGVDTVASWSTDGGPLAVPRHYTFVPGVEAVVHESRFPRRPDVMVTLDCGSAERLGRLRHAAEAAGTLIVVDHHAVGEPFGDIRLVDGQAAATAVLVAELIDRLGEPIDAAIATCLYVGLVTDTGRFQYASTTPAVLELAARLLSVGIDHADINQRIWESHSFGYVRLLGRALDRAVFAQQAGLAWTAVFQADLADLGVAWEETEGVIDLLRRVEAAECSMVCKQQPSSPPDLPIWKTSLRSRGRIDVGAIARRMGGGGHTFASGFTGQGALDDLVTEVVKLLSDSAPAGGRP